MEIHKFWCEWDIGCNDDLFECKETMIRIVSENLIDCGIEDDIDGLIAEGLLGFESKYTVEAEQ